jgi:hypothetical protein
MPTAVADFVSLLQGIPAGAWVAISEREHRVIAFGPDALSVHNQAIQAGELHPLMVRVPDQNTAMFL